MMEQFKISSLDAVRTASDPQRQRILALLIDEPLTVQALAKRLRLARTRLYYHIELLERHGLVRVVAERSVAALTERTYRATAKRFIVDSTLFSAKDRKGVTEARAALLEQTAEDLRVREAAGVPTSNSGEFVMRRFMQLNNKHRVAFQRDLERIVDRYAEHHDDNGQATEITFALFPMKREATS